MASNFKTVQLEIASVPRIFSMERGGGLCARDVIAVVRGTYEPDPWVPVVIDLKGKGSPVAVEELEGSSIYWKGVNDAKAGMQMGISVYSYFVVDAKALDGDGEDCGLIEKAQAFRMKYDIQSFDILITGDKDDSEVLAKMVRLKDYLLSTEREDFIFPAFIVEQNKLRKDGFDISPIASEVDRARQRNMLDYKVLGDILSRVNESIVPGVTVIQDIKGMRTRDVKLLSTYYTLKHTLPPAYVSSFIAEYIKFEFVYPRTKLSLYERVAFLHRLPRVIGYIGTNQSFNCLADVREKIYPAPHYIFDLDAHRVLSEEEFFPITSPGCHFADFRTMFRDSLQPIAFTDSTSNKAIAQAGSGQDEVVNKQLVDMFYELSLLVDSEQVFLSVKNSMLVERNGKRYLFYCPEECGVRVVLLSEFFGYFEYVITEGEFRNIIDAQIVRALLQRDHAPNDEAGSTALAVTWKKIDPNLSIRPAIPLEVTLNMYMLPQHRNGLSYYDSQLRCHLDVLPIITSHDSDLRDISPLFKTLTLESLRGDPQARYAVNCFGTLANQSSQAPVLPLTYKAFKQRRLL